MSSGGGTCPNPDDLVQGVFMLGITALSMLQCEIGDTSIYPDDANPANNYDFIVVGAGSAGCVVANRLSAIEDWKILLIEAGGDPPYDSEVPAFSTTLHNTDIDWKYRTDGEGNYCLGMEAHQCRWPRGKVLGGSSVLNTMAYLRGHPEDYSRWVRKGNEGWSYEDLIPFFHKSEGLTEDGDVGHLNLEPFDGGASTGNLPLLEPLKYTTRELGNKATLEPDILSYPGYFNTYATILNGTRYSAAKAYLAPIKERKNLDVVKNALVTKILFNSKNKAIGVKYEKSGNKYSVHSRKEVIVSAGSIGSPQLLMLSGIGPRNHLRELGISVRANLPVGHNLQDHVLFPGVVASINRDVGVPPDATKGLIRDVVNYLVDRKGTLSGIGYIQFTGFVHSTHSKDSTYPGNQIQFALFSKGDLTTLNWSLSAFGYNEEVSSAFVSLVNESDTLFVLPSVIHPKSRGRLRLASTDPREHPRITPKYFDDSADEEVMLEGIAEAMRILRSSSFKQAVRVEPRAFLKQCLGKGKTAGRISKDGNIDDSPIMTERYWRCAMRQLSSSDYHPVGTCQMGPNSVTSVVDPRLRVHLVERLRVIDGSIMPTITSGNINGPVVAIAEKGASMIIEDWTK